MIPDSAALEENDAELTNEPSRSFCIDFEEKVMGGFIDGLDAVKQSIFCILQVERFEHLIYSWDYGVELTDLVGMDSEEVLPELEERISEALLRDDRILAVEDFSFTVERSRVLCRFRAVTVFGDLENLELEVDV